MQSELGAATPAASPRNCSKPSGSPPARQAHGTLQRYYRDVKEWTTFRDLLDSNRGLISTAANDERVLEVAIKLDPIGESETQIREVRTHALTTPPTQAARHSCHMMMPSTAKRETAELRRNSRDDGARRENPGHRRLSPRTCAAPRLVMQLTSHHNTANARCRSLSLDDTTHVAVHVASHCSSPESTTPITTHHDHNVDMTLTACLVQLLGSTWMSGCLPQILWQTDQEKKTQILDISGGSAVIRAPTSGP